MKYYSDADLSAKVKAVNAANDKINTFAPQVVELVRGMIGCKITNVDGKPSKAYGRKLTDFGFWGSDTRVYIDIKTYSVILEVTANSPSGEVSLNHTSYLYCGDVRDGILTGVSPQAEQFEPFRTEYTVEEIRAAIKAVDEADNKLRAAQAALGPFA